MKRPHRSVNQPKTIHRLGPKKGNFPVSLWHKSKVGPGRPSSLANILRAHSTFTNAYSVSPPGNLHPKPRLNGKRLRGPEAQGIVSPAARQAGKHQRTARPHLSSKAGSRPDATTRARGELAKPHPPSDYGAGHRSGALRNKNSASATPLTAADGHVRVELIKRCQCWIAPVRSRLFWKRNNRFDGVRRSRPLRLQQFQQILHTRDRRVSTVPENRPPLSCIMELSSREATLLKYRQPNRR